MSGKGSRARYKAMLADVHHRVYYALYCGDHANPYPVEDKRYDLFTRKLAQTLALDEDFKDTMRVMGGDPDTLARRPYAPPGPVEPLDVLGERWLRQREEEALTADA